MVSENKRIANQFNAQKSTGPRTAVGKLRSSRNAITHGLFTSDLILRGESRGAFRALRRGMIESLRPQNLAELMIVDRLVAATWKQRRLRRAEKWLHNAGEQELMRINQEEANRAADDFEVLGGPPISHDDIADELHRAGVPASVVLAARLNKEHDQVME